MPRIKSALALPNGKAYLFWDTAYNRYDFATGAADYVEGPTAANWPGLAAAAPDAALYWGAQQAFFFYGDSFVRYDLVADSVAQDYLPPNVPRLIADYWPGLWADRVDAAVNWGNGKAYFFRDGEYCRYDITSDRVDPDYPKPIAGNWDGIWDDRVDAVLYQGGTKAYFFRDDICRSYELATGAVGPDVAVALPGVVSNQLFDPVPSGMVKAARDLSPAEANAIVSYLMQNMGLQLSGNGLPAAGARVQVKPASIGGVAFQYANQNNAVLIDNLDQRMLVALYRLTRWLNGSAPNVSTLRHLGIGHGQGAANDCHNQGRALDFSGVDGDVNGAPFALGVKPNWGDLPGNGTVLRLDPAIDQTAYILLTTAVRFGAHECECNGIGAANTWPLKEIGETGGYVIHPDYVDQVGGQALRAQHQDHVHMQIGPTLG